MKVIMLCFAIWIFYVLFCWSWSSFILMRSCALHSNLSLMCPFCSLSLQNYAVKSTCTLWSQFFYVFCSVWELMYLKQIKLWSLFLIWFGIFLLLFFTICIICAFFYSSWNSLLLILYVSGYCIIYWTISTFSVVFSMLNDASNTVKTIVSFLILVLPLILYSDLEL